MATKTYTDKSIINVFGPWKEEIIPLTSVSDEDTVVSNLQSPQLATYHCTTDATGTSTNPSCTISGRTVTINDPPTATGFLRVLGL